jgi:hypothetical protein
MPSAKTIAAGTIDHQRRRDMSTSSGFGASSSETVRGSSAIPQIGHVPGTARTISGCIGQMNSVFSLDAGDAGALAAASGEGCAVVSARGSRNFAGSAMKRSRHRGPQKKYVLPSWSAFSFDVAGSTDMPHTGSITVGVGGMPLAPSACGCGSSRASMRLTIREKTRARAAT